MTTRTCSTCTHWTEVDPESGDGICRHFNLFTWCDQGHGCPHRRERAEEHRGLPRTDAGEADDAAGSRRGTAPAPQPWGDAT